MENFYGEDCFLYRNGAKIVTSNRKFLDFRKDKVRNHLTQVIDRMVGYGIGYIKFDYNQDCGPGTERDSDSLGDGLQEHAQAYWQWVKETMERHPEVIIEACASGGQRMDYKTLSLHPLTSTSDQTDYRKYPFIAGNILSAVLPEQAAVWSYPVESSGVNSFDVGNSDLVNGRITEEQVIMNMINSFLGRMHLASAIHLLDPHKKELIKEGVAYYKTLVEPKKKSVPYFPWGFTDFYQKEVASGFISGNKLYLAVWNVGGDGNMEIEIPEFEVKSANISYPKQAKERIRAEKHKISLTIAGKYAARFIEAEISARK